MPTHHTEMKSFRQPTQEPNPFNSTLETSQVRSPTLKSSQLGLHTQDASQFACSLNTSDFRPAFKI